MDGAEWKSNDLHSMLRICTLLQSVRALYAARTSSAVRAILEKHLLLLILELIPADRGAIILEGARSGDFEIEAHWLEQVMSECGPVTGQSAGRQVLLAPLIVRSEVAGVIYLDSFDAASLGEPQALLLAAIAEIASLALENAFQVEWLEGEIRSLETGQDLGSSLIGRSSGMENLRDRIARIAPTNTTVLILGESGTGKELVARALHQHSPRAAKPFVAINCAALSETLLESELFGHEKGAFTGAVAQKRGRLEVAEGGTVFLDEIGEMPVTLQAKLLRVLQQREFERVGGTRSIPLNIRVIAATNRDLADAIRQSQFRSDLFYRLNVVSIRMPSLRDRPDDIILLATQFSSRIGERCGRRVSGISPEARALLRTYPWPGNVRELENAIEHAVVLGSTDLILAADLPDSLRDALPANSGYPASESPGMLHDAIHAAKRAVIQRAMEQAMQDHVKAAHLLGVHPNYLYRLIKNVNLPAVKTTGA
jgi:two-component system response regulator HydG